MTEVAAGALALVGVYGVTTAIACHLLSTTSSDWQVLIRTMMTVSMPNRLPVYQNIDSSTTPRTLLMTRQEGSQAHQDTSGPSHNTLREKHIFQRRLHEQQDAQIAYLHRRVSHHRVIEDTLL
jgi:hypothetical protein